MVHELCTRLLSKRRQHADGTPIATPEAHVAVLAFFVSCREHTLDAGTRARTHAPAALHYYYYYYDYDY